MPVFLPVVAPTLARATAAVVLLGGRRVEFLVRRETNDIRKHYDHLWGLFVALGRNHFGNSLYAFIDKSCKRAHLL